MADVRHVGFADILDAENAPELIAEYSAECSIPEIGEPNPQRDLYATMERTGLAQSFGAYRDGQLAGFAIVLIYVLPHYGKWIATVESLFVASAHRNSEIGRELMAAIEKYAKEKGCKVILYSAPTNSRLSKLLSLKEHYRRTNSIFCRSLN